MLMRSDGTNERVLRYEGPSLTTGSQALAYSPDGRYLAGGALLRSSYGSWTDHTVTILDLKTKKSRIIAHIGGMNGITSLSWSPGSSQLAVTSEDGGGYNLYRIDVAKRRLLKSHVGLHESVSWRPDGQYLLCTTWFPTDPGVPFRTQLIEPGGVVAATLGNDQRWAVYSPDGARYAFLRYAPADASDSLRIASGDGSGVTTIYTGASGEQLSPPAWR
jgi:Tol biopolymer transport system component